MRLLCVLLAAAAASAAEIDINAPGFWTKAYAIPRAYCERSVTLTSERAEKLVAAASPCKFAPFNGGVRSECRIPRAESDLIVGRLRQMGALTAYSQNCDPAPSYPELYYKRDNLRRERDEINLSSVSAPAINGLLEAQLATLDQLIASLEGALETSLSIVIVSPEVVPPFVGAYGERKSAKVARKISRLRYPQDEGTRIPSWARRPLAACQQIDPIVVEYERAGGPADAERLNVARRLGETYVDPGCGLLNNTAYAAAIFSTKPEAEIRRKLTGLAGLRAWRVWTLNGGEVVPDDRRFDMLSAELSEQREALARAPHIRGLVRAEIERVREGAERLRRLRRGRLLLIQFTQ